MENKKDKLQNLTQEILLENNVKASVIGNTLTVKGSGEVTRTFKQRTASIKVEGDRIVLLTKRNTKKDKKILGSLTAHIRNMIRGSQNKHVYTLKICAGHFPMNVSVSNNKLVVKNFLGEKVPRTLMLKGGTEVKVEGEIIKVTSSDKELAGQVSSDIEQLMRRPGFDTRVFQDGIYIINKDGKDLK